MKNDSYLPPAVRLSEDSELKSGMNSGITRRSFIKRTGGATVATMVAWHLGAQQARAGEGSDGSQSGSGSFTYMIKCVAWPNPAHDQSYNYVDSLDYYVTNVFMTGATEGQKAPSFTIGINASGIHHWRPWYSTSMKSEAAQEEMSIRLWLDGDKIKVTHLSGDGKDKNGDMEIVVSVASLVECKAYLMKSGWGLESGTIGWNGEAATAGLNFTNGSEEIDSVGLGSGFTVVRVDANGNEI